MQPATSRADKPVQRVLLVEDDDAVRRSLHLLLHSWGYEVRSFCAVEPALRDPQVTSAAVMLADYRLPDGDGLGLLRALARRGWAGRSVLMTGFPSATLSDAATACGYDRVLEKPLRHHELANAISG